MIGSIQVAGSVIAFTIKFEMVFKETLGCDRVSWMTDLLCPDDPVLSNFDKSATLVFSPQGTCMMLTYKNWFIRSLTFARHCCKMTSLTTYTFLVFETTKSESVIILTGRVLKSLANNSSAMHAAYLAWLFEVVNENFGDTSTIILSQFSRMRPALLPLLL